MLPKILAGALIGSSSGSSYGQQKPNILFMFGDDHGQADIPWDNPYLADKLPNFSRLRNSGTLIKNHYTAVGCSPSRGMLLTGRNSEKTGFNYLGHLCYDTFLDDSVKFMPAYFKPHGYKTFHVGKWHVGSAKWSQTPTGRGFDESYHSLGGYLDYWTYGSPAPPMCKNAQGLFKARDTYDAKSDAKSGWHDYKKVDIDELEANNVYLTTQMTKVAIDKIKNSDEPFFMYKAWHAPHFPFHAPAKNRNQFLDDLAPISQFPAALSALNETRDTIETKLDAISTLGPFLTSQQHILGDAFNAHGMFKGWNMTNPDISDYVHRVARGMYLSNVKTLDDHIGDLFEALEETGKLDNTYIIYASDNGGAVDNYQSAGKKRGYKKIPFEGGVNTFATISGPGIPAGAEYKGIFHLTDWLPTLSTAMGIDNDFEGIDGVDHFDAISKLDGVGPRTDVHLHYQFALDENVALGGKIWASPMMAMRSGRYKLIGGLPKEVQQTDVELPFMWYSFPDDPADDHVNQIKQSDLWKSADPNSEGQQWWLFDLASDPYETRNLLITCGDDCSAELTMFGEMRAKMASHVEECNVEQPKFDKRGAPVCFPADSKNWRDCWWRPGYVNQ